jgi:hypothetical protein
MQSTCVQTVDVIPGVALKRANFENESKIFDTQIDQTEHSNLKTRWKNLKIFNRGFNRFPAQISV